MVSKNDIFATTWAAIPPPPGRATAAAPIVDKPLPLPPPALQLQHLSSSNGWHDEREDEVEAVPPSATLQLHLLPAHNLGRGRHASVILGACRFGEAESWRLCAAKQMSDDRESQLAGFHEAFILSKLRGHPSILTFIAIKDNTHTGAGSRRTSCSSIGSLNSHASSSARRERAASASSPTSPIEGSFGSFSRPLPLSSIPMDGLDSSLRRSATLKHAKATHTPTRRSPDEPYPPGFDSHSRNLILLTEYCRLGNLLQLVTQHGTHILGRRMFFKLAIDLMRAIVHTHSQHVIHGDVKPQNCMIDRNFDLKLGDFSSSVFASSNLLDGVALGTTHYSPPELIQLPPQPFSSSVDVFAAGLTLLFMITGVEPYETLLSTDTPHRSTSSRSSRRKMRHSSSAKMVELHLHLSKGHAWEWEEQRRLEELEDFDYDGFAPVRRAQAPQQTSVLHLRPLQIGDLIDSTLQAAFEGDDSALRIPPDLIDPLPSVLPGHYVVPPELRKLIRQMLEADAAERPSAEFVLKRLQQLRDAI